MLTFTGERVIPGAVEPDLWNEHISRYYFAREFAQNRRLLDIGCGTGYGTILIGEIATQSLGIDVSDEAIEFAIEHAQGRAQFCVASAEALPVANQSFSVVTAFEVIEHIIGWKDLLSEAARVVTPDGVFLVSTPNQSYYAETRQGVGSNPFHVHEFELSEFQNALEAVFAHVTLLAQNHQEVVVFADESRTCPPSVFLPALAAMADAHFFVAVCSHQHIAVPAYLYANSSGNLLRDRENYIRLLKEEVDFFTSELTSTRSELVTKEQIIASKEQVIASKEQIIASKEQIIAPLQTEFECLKAKFAELQSERQAAVQSKWLRLGGWLGLGPDLRERT